MLARQMHDVKNANRAAAHQAAEVGDLSRAVALEEEADQQEQRAGGQAVVDHVQAGRPTAPRR